MNRRPTIKINQGRFLPLWLRLIISIALLAAIAYFNNVLERDLAIGLSILLAAPVFPLWNSFYVLELDSLTNSFRRAVWLAGQAFGGWKKYEKIRKVEIKKTGIINKIFFGRKSHEAYFMLDEDKQIYVLGDRSKEALLERLKEIEKKLDISVSN